MNYRLTLLAKVRIKRISSMGKHPSLFGFLMFVGLVQPVGAQVTNLPPEAAAAFRANGAVLNSEMNRSTVAVLAPLQPASLPAGVREAVDIHYGNNERQRLDVYAPEAAANGAGSLPVLMFVHGGGFVMGDKRREGMFFNQHVGYMTARNGLVGVVLTYRLAPQHPFPAGAEDVAAAIAWVRANIATFRGDPQRIVLMGHSSGAAHVADYVAQSRLQPTTGPALAGVNLASGIYDAPTMNGSPALAQYYSADKKMQAEHSAFAGLVKSSMPIMISIAELGRVDKAHEGDSPDAGKYDSKLIFVQEISVGSRPSK